MSFGEYNGGDEATWVKAIIFFILLGVAFGLIWLFGPENIGVGEQNESI